MTPLEASRLLSDARIARRAAGGDERAFEAIFARYNQDLYRYCAAILGNAEDAHDAVQTTMLKVLRALPGEKRDLKLKPWLYRIAHNEAIDLIRARRTTEPVDADSLVDGTDPAREAEARDRLQLLIADISALPDRQRGALVMREMGGLSYEQIGEALRTSSAVARQTIYETRLSLRQMSEGREMPCEEVMRAISDEDGRVLRRRTIRAHLLGCENCQAFRVEISQRREKLAAIAPLPAVVSAGILQGLLGGSAAAGSGATAAGTAGAAAGKALVSAAAIKSAAAVCAVTAVGIFAADNRGLIDLGGADRQQDPAAGEVAKPASPQGDPAVVAPEANAAGAAATVGKPLHPDDQKKARRAAAIKRGEAQSNPAPTTQTSSEQTTPGSNGRHLGSSKSSSHGAKPSHPSKGKKSPAPPGQLKSPGQAKHAASGKATGTKQAEARPPHPTHPEKPPHPAQSQAPDPNSAPSETTEPSKGKSGKAVAE